MHLSDIYTLTFLSSKIDNFKLTGNEFFDTIIIGFLIIFYFCCNNKKVKNIFYEYIDSITDGNYNKYKITAKKERFPISFKAILWFISNNKNNSLRYLEQYTDFSWDRQDNLIEKERLYLIKQYGKFKITNDIYGLMNKEFIEKARHGDNIEYKDIHNLILYSKIKKVDEIIKWIDNIVKDYRNYMKLKTIETQLLLNISYQDKMIIETSNFDSTATFKNTYLPNYNEIMNKINFFLNNKSWYIEKGIPYNLGIILYGEPGCGKTRFIKQLMNYTGRHGVDIKLNNKFCFNTLKNIIHNENITDEFIIPQDKRIIIFEDIDAMCDILKDRELIKKENDKFKENIKITESKLNDNNKNDTIIIKDENKLNNNNLSFFLNIIDGLNECSGRIIIMTTNKIDYLDKAIIRPGRIDIKINFIKYNLENICGIINKFWKKKFNINDIKKDIDQKYTSAEIINIFRSSNNFEDIKNLFIN